MNKQVWVLSLGLAFGGICLAAESEKPGQVEVQSSHQAPPQKPSMRCAPATGSRIAKPVDQQGRCDHSAYPSRSYSAEDLKRTGEIDLGAALEKIDPGFRR